MTGGIVKTDWEALTQLALSFFSLFIGLGFMAVATGITIRFGMNEIGIFGLFVFIATIGFFAFGVLLLDVFFRKVRRL